MLESQGPREREGIGKLPPHSLPGMYATGITTQNGEKAFLGKNIIGSLTIIAFF